MQEVYESEKHIGSNHSASLYAHYYDLDSANPEPSKPNPKLEKLISALGALGLGLGVNSRWPQERDLMESFCSLDVNGHGEARLYIFWTL